MKNSAYFLIILFLFTLLAGCQSLPTPGPESDPNRPVNQPTTDTGNREDQPPTITDEIPVKKDEDPYTLNTGKVDQMVIDGYKPEEVLVELKKLEKDIKNDQQQGMYYVRHAEVLMNMGDDKKAVEEFTKVTEINAKPISKLLAYSYIASIYNKNGNQKEALQCIEKARKIYSEIIDEDKNPRILIYFASSAMINSDRGDYEGVIKDLDSADELINKFGLTTPEYKEPITLEKAYAYSMLKQPEKALATIKKWPDAGKTGETPNLPLNKDMDDLEIRYKVALAKGEFDKALKCTEELKSDNNFIFHLAKGNVYYVWGKNDEARKEFELALKESKDSSSREQAENMLKRIK